MSVMEAQRIKILHFLLQYQRKSPASKNPKKVFLKLYVRVFQADRQRMDISGGRKTIKGRELKVKSCVSLRIVEDCEAASPSLGSGGTRVWSRPGGPQLDRVQ